MVNSQRTNDEPNSKFPIQHQKSKLMASGMITEQDVNKMTPQECRDNEEKIHEQWNEAHKDFSINGDIKMKLIKVPTEQIRLDS